ncbi:MAG: response regulator, partial [Nitrospiraceae bacterium]|nr:response regulator [Nitrospiraceae bacterium]
MPTAVRGDPHRLRQILINLIGNAWKFTEQGEVVVSVALQDHTPEQTSFLFDVRDTGIGIAPEAQAHIFEAFSQADGSTTRKYGGTGLGLTIVKQLVEMMGGTVGVRSAAEQGSVFWFTVSLLAPLAPAKSSPKHPAALRHVRALIVDDNATNRFILQKHLSSWGFTYTSAHSGPMALQILKESVEQNQRYDLVILDMQMPGMDGLMVARAIRAVPELHAVRLIMLTSSGTGDAQAVREAGIAVSMTKPVRKAQLYDCLTNVMGASTAPTAQTSERRMVHSGTTSSGARILLAEDNPVNQEVALGMLDALGHLVDVVGTGREAVNASVGTDYDLIFMDCQMPEMDGLSATRAIRAREAQALGTGGKRDSRGTRADDPCHIPIIALTAHAMASDRELCLAAGMDDYLSKPFTQDQLSTMLTRWLPGLERRQPPISPSHPEHLSHPPDP